MSTMIPNTMFSPIVVTIMKKEISNRMRRPDVSNCWGTRGITCIIGRQKGIKLRRGRKNHWVQGMEHDMYACLNGVLYINCRYIKGNGWLWYNVFPVSC